VFRAGGLRAARAVVEARSGEQPALGKRARAHRRRVAGRAGPSPARSRERRPALVPAEAAPVYCGGL